MPLTREEITRCREAFDKFDKDGSGSVDLMELKASLNGLGAQPSEEELHMMIRQVDEDGSNDIHFAEFLKIIEAQKAKHDSGEDHEDADTVEAWVALGGAKDTSGGVPVEKLTMLIADFDLHIAADDISIKANEEGLIDFAQFKAIMA
uniref:EF-hand domain-containing protein n=1 Tax=Pyramimonas obovata TaxID=1411642 RepID=A0A7S0MRZ2_9CHLO|mmetsp:Transcript_12081/g.25392  ORF Transcript_12081/g.25392 Transcript_12081/m.25392 type:complete len:148 (+) Transcript_12081:499-942(+)|eukprot:CAMPEP_0118925728 /NCGR_PEP_ID=MMETSP1169-20130426/3562_1 /TAXON_ID=36882 /ORGANISM="Pyramimonas obovata, Strain CCMP722" /LENGTH=147 /DNA_ID=CAMNT_0006867107 /DNA_START=466 /DNA_END=909 /DNA_ORIENTATION=-